MSTSTQGTNALAPITISINCNPGKKYKSIENINWENIPPFAIVTGLNGSGKSQLLELIAHKLTGTQHHQPGILDGISVQISGDNFPAESIAYIPSRWEITGAAHIGIQQLQQAKSQTWSELSQNQNQYDLRSVTRRARLQKIFGGGLSLENFTKKLPDDYSFMLEDADAVAGIAHVIVAYRLRSAEELERGTPREELKNKLGVAPWDLINEIFQTAEFPYSIVSPTETPIAGIYKLELEHRISKDRIPPGDLSSGEKMLLVLVLWLYTSKHHGRFPM